MTAAVDPAPASRPSAWSRLDERFEPWASDAFAAGAGLVLLSGVVSLGVWAGLGDGFAGTWGFLLTGLAVVVAYLAEVRVERPFSAACTAIVAAGVPVAIVFLQWPVRDYDSVRAIEAISIIVWLAMFLVGGTRARAVLLGLALFTGWFFAIGEAGNFEHAVPSPTAPFSVVLPQTSSSFGTSDGGSGQITFDSNGNPIFPNTPPVVRRTEDRTLAIGITSAIAGALFLFGLRRADRSGRRALGTAFVIPGFVAVVVAVIAIAAREGDVWFGGVLALVTGLAVAWVANGRRRFLTWTGAIGAALGVLLVSGDTSSRVTAHHTADGALHYAIFALLFGLAGVLASVPVAALLREPVSAPEWFGRRTRPQPPRPPDAAPPITDLT